VLLLLALAIHFANRHAYASGLSASFSFGNGLLTPYKFRIPGVLQRIGVCYGIAGTIALFAGWRTVLASLVIFCAAYSVLMLKAPFDEHTTGSLTKEDNLARRIDERVFHKHVYGQYPDPEGLLSTLPAIGSVLIGILVGTALRRPDRTHVEKCAALLARGVLVTIAGVLLGWWLMPINKQIWTPSFTVFTAGVGMLALGCVFWFTDVRGRRAWAWPFKVYGMNAIAAFVISGVIVRIALLVRFFDGRVNREVTLWTWCQQRAADGVSHFSCWLQRALPNFPSIDTPQNTSLAFALAYVVVIFALMWLLYAAGIFVKV
jgi:predicted acyltransferase